MTRQPRRRRRSTPTARTRWEGLETRLALSTVIGTEPATGSLLAASPAEVRVHFDAPIDLFSLLQDDVLFERVGDDGSLAPAFDTTAYTPDETLSDDGRTLGIRLQEPLAPGHYRIIIPGTATLAGLDGSLVANPDGSDLPLSDFTVGRPGVTLSDATDLGTITPEALSVPGALDFAARPADVKLYKFELPDGHTWRLGAEVAAQRVGSPLNAALALFDAQGRPIKTDDVGRPDAPNDPFLFAGLAPGTYYLGVSGSNNLPDAPGGYDPASGGSGNAAGQDQPGGPFTLSLVADEADVPGVLTDFRVDHLDPLDPTPTGFSLRFSTALDLGASGSDVFARTTGGIEVVDAAGRAWQVAAVNYDAAHGAIGFLFRDRLPEGAYTIRLAADHPLVDLAGHSPVSPTMPQGVLATFAVLPDTRVRNADGSLPPANADGAAVAEDLGPMLPNPVLAGIGRTFTLQPGQTATFRYVALYADFYKLSVVHSSDDVSIEIGPDDFSASLPLDPGPSGVENSLLADLPIGAYVARFTATGDRPVTITARIGIAAFSWDSLLANGLGQGPALNLRLVSPDGAASFRLGDAPSAAPPLTPSGAPTDGAAFGPFAAASLVSITPGVGASSVPSGNASPASSSASTAGTPLAFEVGGVAVGRPSVDAERVATVGPAEAAGSVALASASPGLGQGPGGTGSLRGDFGASDAAPSRGEEATAPPPAVAPEPDAPSGDPEAPRRDARLDLALFELHRQRETRATEGLPLPSEPEAARPEEFAAPAALASVRFDDAEEAESEGTASRLGAWTVGLLGLTILGARWAARRRASSRRRPAAIASRHVPAPHACRPRVHA